ncbi:uncharacterized protein LOC124931875 [Impatiens glandulifera]|uniref:uncharacterized protein LOC124931875 n=1 Tax=Impatiens glandulifera TaxID=253017 RepID=UPI001FB0988E|nr:uncharacterized protein LOC124931875 [Impatiens glandulifera]XP_047328408.1 uncharacterized protein LOC124931875 [Impatiens glandulifera]
MDTTKLEDGNDNIDAIIKQAIGREPVLSFPRTGESPVQWIQLLHALDQQDLPGWPLLSPLKIQMQKCEKCSREFCSQLNYRRHIRVHRRSLKFDKGSHKIRDLLGSFWDKLSVSEAKEVVSFDDVTLEEVPGSSVIRALTFIGKPGFCTLPQAYVRAGVALLDIIQARNTRFPITSKELFSILDDASESTFLCAGTAESMQKYVFDGEAGKIGLEMKNVVACASFLLERKLVKSWLADKDAEALMCQKLLVEEEEAAQKRQAELLERKKQKKLRQKAKDATNVEKADLEVPADAMEHSPTCAETSSPPSASESSSGSYETGGTNLPLSEQPIEDQRNEEVINIVEAQIGNNDSFGTSQQIDRRTSTQGNGRKYSVIPRWQVQRSQRNGRNGFDQNQPMSKPEQQSQRHYCGPNSSKVWTRKSKSENTELRLQKKDDDVDEHKNCELMFGSISVNLDSYATSRSTVKLWQPVSSSRNRQGLQPSPPLENGGSNDVEGSGVLYSSDDAKSFLAHRWKEAIIGEHVRLALSDVEEKEVPIFVGSSPPKHTTEKGVVAKTKSSSRTQLLKLKYVPKQKIAAAAT